MDIQGRRFLGTGNNKYKSIEGRTHLEEVLLSPQWRYFENSIRMVLIHVKHQGMTLLHKKVQLMLAIIIHSINHFI